MEWSQLPRKPQQYQSFFAEDIEYIRMVLNSFCSLACHRFFALFDSIQHENGSLLSQGTAVQTKVKICVQLILTRSEIHFDNPMKYMT